MQKFLLLFQIIGGDNPMNLTQFYFGTEIECTKFAESLSKSIKEKDPKVNIRYSCERL